MASANLVDKMWGYINANDCEAIKRLCDESPEAVNLTSEEENTPLHCACDNGTANIVEVLCQKGANVNTSNMYDETPLHRAAYGGFADCVVELLKYKADVNSADEDMNTPLHLAAIGGRVAVAKALTEAGAGVNKLNKYQRTPVHWACNEGHLDVVQFLLNCEVDLTITDKGGQTPIDLAKSVGDEQIVRLLKDASLTTGEVPESPWAAAENGDTTRIRAWLKFADINGTNENNETPVFSAAKSGHKEILLLLLTVGADPNITNNENTSPLLIAAMNGHATTVETLLRAGADEMVKNQNGVTVETVTKTPEVAAVLANASKYRKEGLQAAPGVQRPRLSSANLRIAQAELNKSMKEFEKRAALIVEQEEQLMAREQRVQELERELKSQEIATEINADDLKVLEKVGSGCYGEVFRAEYQSQIVALKKVMGANMNSASRKEFYEEVSLLRRLRHPNTVLFLGQCTKEPHLYMVTEFLGGGTLYDLLHVKNEKLPMVEACRLAINIASGLSYLHANNIVHRDVKSLNVLLDGNCNKCRVAKVADFGLSRSKQNTFVSTAHSAAGTLVYMAPEQLDELPIDEKVDVYAFGMLLWELVTGTRPWNGKQFQSEVVSAVLRGERPKIPSSVPTQLKEIIQSCWQHNPSQRWTLAEALSQLTQTRQYLKSMGDQQMFQSL